MVVRLSLIRSDLPVIQFLMEEFPSIIILEEEDLVFVETQTRHISIRQKSV
ncbi:unnamed protein product [Schistosoma mattheei]|uniref:Uncharacterized protein n=1 Tax=Schistosoma mattheei TaxID=31246 RepID=A0A183PW61_9TREM|nr:unnamed protein product [Schistosoma mattheei]